MTLLLTVIVVALIFEYINGFHDTANSIATVVSTKVLTPRLAILLAAVTNLVGALYGAKLLAMISPIPIVFSHIAIVTSLKTSRSIWLLKIKMCETLGKLAIILIELSRLLRTMPTM